MFRLVLLLLSVALCSGQLVDLAKLRRIYRDMDNDLYGETDPFRDDLTKPEVNLFFLNMSSYPNGDGLIFPNFDYWWGTAYGDSIDVTLYFFRTWDQNNNTLLDTEDLDVMYDAIDTDKTEPANALSQINIDKEFIPYFDRLYQLAGIGRVVGK